MLTGFVVAFVVLAGLACPLLMLLGRRGIGPGCAIMGCSPQRDEDTLESLRAQHEQLLRRLEALETGERLGSNQFERA